MGQRVLESVGDLFAKICRGQNDPGAVLSYSSLLSTLQAYKDFIRSLLLSTLLLPGRVLVSEGRQYLD